MPLFTFICSECGLHREVVCKVAERDAMAVDCAAESNAPYSSAPCPGIMRWSGVPEGSQTINAKGVYKFALLDSKGAKHVSPKAESARGRRRR